MDDKKRRKKSSSKLYNVSTLEMSEKVTALSQCDTVMRIRVGSLGSDLIAAEGKYHLSCWVQFQRQVSSSNQEQNVSTDQHLDEICASLIKGLSEEKVYSLNDVWQTYASLCQASNIVMTPKYCSRRYTFYEDVQKRISSAGSIVRPLDPNHMHFFTQIN